jgi:hypothetical protein
VELSLHKQEDEMSGSEPGSPQGATPELNPKPAGNTTVSALVVAVPAPVATPETFRQKIIDALNDLLVLHVTTVIGHVGTVQSHASGAISTVGLDDPAPKVANTVINMVTGCSTVTYTPDFLADAALMALHTASVKTARDVRTETIALLKTALDNFEALLNKKPGA